MTAVATPPSTGDLARLHVWGRRWQPAVLAGGVCLAWLVFAAALVGKHRAYHSWAYDFGYFDQVLWNTAHGRWFESSFVPYSFLGEHFSPVLLLFAAIYRIYPHAEVLLLTQVTVASLAAVPLYIAARRLLASATAGLLIAFAYLLAPQLHQAILFDFHPEVLGTAAIFAGLACLVARRPGWAIAAFALLFTLKEDAALAAFGFAWLLWLRGYRRHAVLLGIGALAFLIVVVGALMPWLRAGEAGMTDRYSYLGASLPDVFVNAALHPGRVWAHLADPSQRHAVGDLLAAVAYLPLLTPAGLIALPDLIANLLSAHEPQAQLRLHYGIYPLALATAAGVFGVAAASRAPLAAALWERPGVPVSARPALVAGCWLIASALAWLINSPLGTDFHSAEYRPAEHAAAVDDVIAAVPAGAAVSAQSTLVPHLSHRRDIWEFPLLESATAVVVDRHGPVSWQSHEEYDQRLADLPDLGFCRAMERDGVELYLRCR